MPQHSHLATAMYLVLLTPTRTAATISLVYTVCSGQCMKCFHVTSLLSNRAVSIFLPAISGACSSFRQYVFQLYTFFSYGWSWLYAILSSHQGHFQSVFVIQRIWTKPANKQQSLLRGIFVGGTSSTDTAWLHVK